MKKTVTAKYQEIGNEIFNKARRCASRYTTVLLTVN